MPLIANRICTEPRQISCTWGQMKAKLLPQYVAYLKCFQMCAVHMHWWKRDC